MPLSPLCKKESSAEAKPKLKEKKMKGTRYFVALCSAFILSISTGCFENPTVNVDKIELNTDVGLDSCSTDSTAGAISTREELLNFIEFEDAKREIDLDALRNFRISGETPSPGDGVRRTVVVGGVADSPGKVGFGNVEGSLGQEVWVPVTVNVNDLCPGPDGIQAIMLDLSLPANLVHTEIDDFTSSWGKMSDELRQRGWWIAGQGVRVIDDKLYLRIGIAAGSGIGLYPGDNLTVYNVRFRIIGIGDGEVMLWQAWDHVEQYVSNMPMPRFDQTSHVYGCAHCDPRGNSVAMSHPISYGQPNSRNVVNLYASYAWVGRDPDGFDSYSLDFFYPLSCDFIYSERGHNIEGWENFVVEQIAPGHGRITASLGNGVNGGRYNWGQIARLDFVPHAVGVVEHFSLSNFGGDLEGAVTGCE